MAVLQPEEKRKEKSEETGAGSSSPMSQSWSWPPVNPLPCFPSFPLPSPLWSGSPGREHLTLLRPITNQLWKAGGGVLVPDGTRCSGLCWFQSRVWWVSADGWRSSSETAPLCLPFFVLGLHFQINSLPNTWFDLWPALLLSWSKLDLELNPSTALPLIQARKELSTILHHPHDW